MEIIRINDKEYIRAADMARHWGIERQRVYAGVERQNLPAIRYLGALMVERAAAEAWRPQPRRGRPSKAGREETP